jgi:hypothetical protein
MLREKHKYVHKCISFSQSSENSMGLNLPISLDSKEVAAFEWEFAGRVLDKYPNFPFASFTINFSSAK